MDRYCKIVLTIIAVSLVVIAVNLSISLLIFRPPAFGDFAKIEAMNDTPDRDHEYEKLLNSMPLVYVHKGNLTAEVSGGEIEVSGGSIEVSGSVQIDDPSSRLLPLNRR